MASVKGLVFLNDAFVHAGQAVISPFDRGFLFGESAYEVMAVIGGKALHAREHVERLRRSLTEIGFTDIPDDAKLLSVSDELVRRNDVDYGRIYLQVSRGCDAARRWLPGEGVAPTIFACVEQDDAMINSDAMRYGIKAISLPEQRWRRRDIKSNNLLAQCMAYRQLASSDADDALMIEDGMVTEAIAATAFMVDAAATVLTRSLSRDILPGITRKMLIAGIDSGLTVEERGFSPEQAMRAAEVFVTSSSRFVVPVTVIDGARIGDGTPGPVTRRMQYLYLSACGIAVPDWLVAAAP